ncbi:MAG TPA: calcium-binding protein [Tepidisphaeraceae bacterium]|nr:calcium-binding protein [Tepidisphaeraceae bacterium]
MARSDRRRRQCALSSACAQIDLLESRRLLASAAVQSGVLTINGDGTNDAVTVAPAAGGQVTVSINGGSSSFSAAAFTSILVNANAGNDNVTIHSAITKPATLKGGAGNDSLTGGGGNDLIDGGTGGDTIKGGGGSDTADYSGRTNAVTVGVGSLADDGEANEKDNVAVDVETILGGSGNDNLKGGGANNRLVGNGGNDTLQGLGGNDTLDGGAGTDSLVGGDGTDTAINSAGDTLVGIENPPPGGGGGGEITITFDGILKVTGTDGADVISMTQPAGGGNFTVKVNSLTRVIGPNDFSAAQFDARGGNDSVTVASPSFMPVTMLGGTGNDSLTGGAGDEFIDGGLGADIIKGGAGIDTVNYSGRTNAVQVGPGTIADDGEANEKDNVAPDIENINGGAGNDTLKGTGAGNTISGGGGNDSIVGNAGNDFLLAGEGNDTVYGGEGNDEIDLGSGDDYADAFIGNDTIRGQAGNDTINGHAGSDQVHGGAGSDNLHGGDDNDTLDGGENADTLNGGQGTDAAVNTAGDTLISIEVGGGGGPAPGAVLSGGVLTVTGSAAADSIQIVEEGTGSLIAIVNGNETFFAASSVKSVVINALQGNDGISVEFSNGGPTGNNGFYTIPTTVNGGDGNDELSLYAASAKFVGGSGDDGVGLNGGAAADFDGGIGIDTYTDHFYNISYGYALPPSVENASIQSGSLTGNALNNVLTLHISGDIDGGGGNDLITSGTEDFFSSALHGGEGNDTIICHGANDTVDGGGGNDLILARYSGGDAFHGGAGNDTIDFSNRTEGLTLRIGVLAADDQDFIDSDVENIIGGSGNDHIVGSDQPNLLMGGGGNDTLSGGGGSDTLNGGDGTDTGVNVAGDALISIENTSGGGGPGQPNTALITAARTLLVTGTAGADAVFTTQFFTGSDPHYQVKLNGQTFDFDTDDFDNILIHLLGGNDTIELSSITLLSQFQRPATLNVGAGDDEIRFLATGGVGTVIGEGGNDTLLVDSDGGIPFFEGGAGTDSFRISNSDVQFLDMAVTMPGVENAQLSTGKLIGNALNNVLAIDQLGGTIMGMDGNDLLVGPGESAATLDGGNGNDTLRGGEAGDLLRGGGGNDTVDYSARTANLTIGVGTLADDGEAGEGDNVYLDIETILGGSGNDSIKGGDANNLLVGNGGNDTLRGNYGNDTLSGNAGTDLLNGEGGSDTATNSAGDILVSIEATA